MPLVDGGVMLATDRFITPLDLMRTHFVLLRATLWLGLPGTADAQFTASMTSVTFNNPISAYMDNHIALSIQRSAFERTLE
jgi:hypothetical protein